MPRAAAANGKLRHKTGVVSRVPCSSRNASAYGTDRNTYLTSTHQRQRTESKGNGQTGGQESSESNFVFRPARCNSLVQAREMASLRHRAIAGWCSTRPRAQWRAAGPRRFTLHRHVGDNGECGDTAPRRSLASLAGGDKPGTAGDSRGQVTNPSRRSHACLTCPHLSPRRIG